MAQGTEHVNTGARLVMLALFALGCPSTFASDTPFDATTRGTSCTSTSRGSLECRYKVGRDLEFSITAVGQSDAGISFIRSNSGGDYYARFGIQHGCVIVAYGERGLKETKTPSEFAFVSPRNGRVYRAWPECQKGN
jgi:hypothetical protein